MSNVIHIQNQSFERVELPEQDYERLLASQAVRLFPEFHWFEFKPRVGSPYGEAHPDAALVHERGDEWWVVEVELARHGIEAHVDDQLRKLRDGWFSTRHFEYIRVRDESASNVLDKIGTKRPQFLVIVDDRSTAIEQAAHENDFALLYVIPFRSTGETGVSSWATYVEGRNPLQRSRRSTGVPVVIEGSAAVVKLRVIRDGHHLSGGTYQLLVGSRAVKAWVEKDRLGIVLALSPKELCDLLGAREYYWLSTTNAAPSRLTAIDP